jgi:hypothetical protein
MLTYSDLIQIPTFEERLEFLRTEGLPSELTFDKLRYLNQRFYNSRSWKTVRESVIGRDLGFDLAMPGREIFGRVLVHHMNPITPKDLLYHSEDALDPEFLITTSYDTHQAIHFGSKTPDILSDRKPGDTKLWQTLS